jgi:hypothetical protein
MSDRLNALWTGPFPTDGIDSEVTVQVRYVAVDGTARDAGTDAGTDAASGVADGAHRDAGADQVAGTAAARIGRYGPGTSA